jgi:predicted GIY-YIG superfamily endonuclease
MDKINIYGIITNTNKKIYIGSTFKDIQKRFNEHLQEYNTFKRFKEDIEFLRKKINNDECEDIFKRMIKNKGKKYTSFDILDYGNNNIILLGQYDNEQRNEKERFFIECYRSLNLCVNKNPPPIPKEKLKQIKEDVKIWMKEYELNQDH